METSERRVPHGATLIVLDSSVIRPSQNTSGRKTFAKVLRICILLTVVITGATILAAVYGDLRIENVLLLALFALLASSLMSGALLWIVYTEVLKPVKTVESYNIRQLEECTIDTCAVMRIPDDLIPDNEIGQLMRSRNLMLDRLENTLMELRDKYERIQKLEKLQSDLTKMVVHDLKNPLAVVMMSLDLLPKEDRLHKREYLQLQLARRGALELMRMVSNLLDISRIEEGKLQLHRQSVSIEKVVKECVHDFVDPGIHGKRTITTTVPRSLPQCLIDRDLIYRVLKNLLSNAIRHTQEDGHIEITLAFREAEGAIQVDVRDNGIGIPEEYHEKIFEKFEQVTAREEGQRTGTGLGLAFCKLAVEAHNGKIWVTSEIRRGSTFSFKLPVSPNDLQEGESLRSSLHGTKI